ncbi:MAG: HD domain-containing protein [Clostridiales bacterium]|nr:HD domain-containing protein [Clostridiales bacterium]
MQITPELAVLLYYDIVFALSVLLTMFYMFKWHKHFDAHITLIFVLVPVINLGYVLMAHSTSLEEAIAVNKFSYLGGCFLEMMVLMAVFSLCDLKMNRWVKVGLFAASAAVYLAALTTGHSDIFYRSVTFARENGIVSLTKDYNWAHTVFRVLVCLFFAFSLGAIFYSYFRKNQVSRKILVLLFLPEVIAMIAFFGGRRLFPTVELLPASYVVAQITYLFIISRISLYDVTDVAIDSLVQNGDVGLIAIDFGHHYLGSNDTAREIFPALNDLTVDLSINRNKTLNDIVRPWLKSFLENEDSNQQHFQDGDINYLVTVSWLYNGRKKQGYQLTLTDDTKNQRLIKLISRYNDDLAAEVDEKTAHIVEMHNKLILGMATMVESRDNSTGGHIKRTSSGVKILLDAMDEKEFPYFTEDVRKRLIKAAPMHDLGKIAVDDEILRKPGRFTPEEFEKMKAHSKEGARIVHAILEGTDDEEFHRIAENVAHYHHERWDGSGYPEGLKGEEIPPEARVMAIADVYDALVSRRVYKERMSFEKADQIMMEGMGTQFAPELEPVYLRARPELERYYGNLEKEEAESSSRDPALCTDH